MASVLKSQELKSGEDKPRPVIFNMEDVQQRARTYLDEVQQQAQEIVQRARQEADSIREQARQEGIAAAEAEVSQRVQQEAQQMSDTRCRTAIQACESTVAELSEKTSEWLALWRDQTVELAARIAEKILRRECEDREETLSAWMEEALVALRDCRDLRVLVHPDDFAVAGRFLQNLSKKMPQAASVDILPDPAIKLGGCIVKSSHGQIDQQLESQLDRLVEQLT